MARASTLSCFQVSGEILSEDMLSLLARPDCKLAGCQSSDFRSPGHDRDPKVEDDIAGAWDILSERWQAIRTEVSSYDTDRYRKRWVAPLLELLDFTINPVAGHTAYAEDGRIPITHRAGTEAGQIPVWVLSYDQDPDEKVEGKGRKRSPHDHLQEYLDLTDDDWGLIVNGSHIRLLHDYHKTLTRNFVEADLETMFDTLDIDAFRVLYRIFHSSRFRNNASGKKPIELLRDASRQQGALIGRELRERVREAINTLGNGFLAADATGELQAALRADSDAPGRFYRALLHVVYRLLFLLYIDAKPHWTPTSDPIWAPVWAESYSITRLRERSEDVTNTRDDALDYWEGLKVTFRLVRDGSEHFGIHPYGGQLFDDKNLWLLADISLPNRDLLDAIRLISSFVRDKQVYRVNFRQLPIDAIGSVYESLLEYEPQILPDGTFSLELSDEGQRRATGSHYTPPDLVRKLVAQALVPLVGERAANASDPEKALLLIKVCDPACGSGAFLIEAMDTIARALCNIRRHGEEPSDLDIREARREVVQHCIFGVDKNPLAVELCKFTLWLHVAHKNLPLSFLDANIRCGDSLVGASQEDLDQGIPDDAFKPVGDDDKKFAAAIRKRNAHERETGQISLAFDAERAPKLGNLAAQYHRILDMPELTAEQVEEKAKRYATFVAEEGYKLAKITYDTWCSAFFWEMQPSYETFPTHEALKRIEQSPHSVSQEFRHWVTELADRHRFFHWEIEFPAVFAPSSFAGEGRRPSGGFDCILGNPPFCGGQKISTRMGPRMLGFLKHYYSPMPGTADLCAAFFRRSFDLITPNGNFAMLATNTIAQGDTREAGLDVITSRGGAIPYAVKSMKWPGEANLEISVVHVHKGEWRGPKILDGVGVPFISPMLDEAGGKPFRLKQNENLSFIGSYVLGMGFVMEPGQAQALIANDPKNADALFPYLVGEDLNSRPDQSPSRWVIDFRNWPLSRDAEGMWGNATEDQRKKWIQQGIVPADFPGTVAADRPDLLAIIREKVKPERDKKSRDRNRQRWWIHAENRPGMYGAIASLDRVLAKCIISKYMSFALVPSGWTYAHKTVIFALNRPCCLALLESSIHMCWAWKYSSTMRLDLNYSPSDCFETFAFPQPPRELDIADLNLIGDRYHNCRERIMIDRQIGLTKVQNLFHDPACEDKDIRQLRRLHIEMDTAVLAAYGWSDIDLGHDFREVREGMRFTISEEAKREVLARLLKLNHKIADKENSYQLNRPISPKLDARQP